MSRVKQFFFFDFRVLGGGGGWVEMEILMEGGGGRLIFKLIGGRGGCAEKGILGEASGGRVIFFFRVIVGKEVGQRRKF